MGRSNSSSLGAGNGLCRLPCPAGTYGDANDVCQLCPPGKSSPALTSTQSSEGLKDCVQCPPGKYKPHMSIFECETRESSTLQIQECMLSGTCGNTCPSACASVGSGLYMCCRAFEDTSKDVCQQLGCVDCQSGHYAGTLGASSCDSCPANAVSELGSKNQSDCKCRAGYEGPDGGNCTKCQSGKFKAGGAGGACVRCEAGKYADTDAATACMECNQGAVSIAGSTACAVDKVNVHVSFTLHTNMSHYDTLKALYLSNIADFAGVSASSISVGTTTGRRLHASSITVVWMIIVPRFHVSQLNPSALASRLNDIGPFITLESWQETCGTGREPLASACGLCAQGKFKNSADNSSCSSCSMAYNGSTTAISGSITAQDCVCPAGYFLNVSAAECEPCLAGKFKPFGAGDCQQCPEGKYSPGTTPSQPSATCIFCPFEIGVSHLYRSPVGSSQEQHCCGDVCDCAAGFEERGDYVCVQCDAGTFKSTNGSSLCSPCQAGKYAVAGASTCIICTAGKYALAKATVCTNCAAGKYGKTADPEIVSDHDEEADCTPCQAGKFSSTIGATLGDDAQYNVTVGGGDYPEEMKVEIRDSSGTVQYTVYGSGNPVSGTCDTGPTQSEECGGYSDASLAEVSPRTVTLIKGETYTMVPADAWGDGWDGGKAQVKFNDVVLLEIDSVKGSSTSAVWGLQEDQSKTFTPTCTECAAGTWSLQGSATCNISVQ